MKFLCDAMLNGLAKWLRIAGFDTKVVDATASDQEVLQQALHEKRVLLTRDAHFLQMKEPKLALVFFSENRTEDCLIHLVKKCSLNLLDQAFTRCLVCNTVFTSCDPKMAEGRVPPDVVASCKSFFYCSKCDKVFWQATHTERMRKKLEELQT